MAFFVKDAVNYMKFMLLVLSISCCICIVHSYEFQQNIDERDVNSVVNGQGILESSRTLQQSSKKKDNFLIHQVLLANSKPSKTVIPYEEEINFYDGHSKSVFHLPSATLMICFSVVFSYMIYIITALMLEPVAVGDGMNPTLKVLLSEHRFHDGIISPIIRDFYEEPGNLNPETPLILQKITSEPHDSNNEKTGPVHLFSSTI